MNNLKSSIRLFFLILFVDLASASFAADFNDSYSIPRLNRQIISYVDRHLGEQIGDGECWALASNALNAVNARWDHHFRFGRRIYPQNETVFPGDIIQLKNVTIKYRTKKSLVIETYQQHTAIIYEVKGNGVYIIANQNVNGSRELQLTELRLNSVVEGTYKIFRPQ